MSEQHRQGPDRVPHPSSASVLTDEVRALIGRQGPVVVAPVPYNEDGHRRFMHALMEDQAMHVDRDAAAATKYGELVAVPLWPLHSLVRGLEDPDPLDPLLTDPDWDGMGHVSRTGLPPIPSPLKRTLNAGTTAEFRQLVRFGDVVHAQARYSDIQERHGSSGPMLIISVEITYTNQHGEVLAVITMSILRR